VRVVMGHVLAPHHAGRSAHSAAFFFLSPVCEGVGVEHDIQHLHTATMLSIVGICVRLYVCGHEERGSEYCGMYVCVCVCCVRVVGEGMISPRGT